MIIVKVFIFKLVFNDFGREFESFRIIVFVIRWGFYVGVGLGKFGFVCKILKNYLLVF